MVNMVRNFGGENRLRSIVGVVWIYVAVVVGTIVALGILSAVAPRQAPTEAWVHAVIVAVFAVLLPLRARAARAGGRGALRAVGIIAAVLLVVNVVEALIPGLFPLWMRILMVVIALLMVTVVLLVVRELTAGARTASSS